MTWSQKNKEKYNAKDVDDRWKNYLGLSTTPASASLHFTTMPAKPTMRVTAMRASPNDTAYWNEGLSRSAPHHFIRRRQGAGSTANTTDAQPASSSILHWHGEAATATARPWLVKNLLPETGVAFIVGQWGMAKTFIALELAGAVMLSSQSNFIDYRIKRHGGVLFIAAEGAASIPLRLNVMLETKFNPQGPQPFTWQAACRTCYVTARGG